MKTRRVLGWCAPGLTHSFEAIDDTSARLGIAASGLPLGEADSPCSYPLPVCEKTCKSEELGSSSGHDEIGGILVQGSGSYLVRSYSTRCYRRFASEDAARGWLGRFPSIVASYSWNPEELVSCTVRR